ncbi:MAG TPA: S-adenosylmethionine:tRNA ribosyltransferase-isomerase, partial [Bacteroidales bacterium]|nr:S-adenosylmethionine:tRNA ribosyltransferase-isomerase [Bacteroidales bacterium]
MNILTNHPAHFEVPEKLSCPQPTEERSIPRDHVRLLVSKGNGTIHHTRFSNLDRYLRAGDILIVNTSATVNSAISVELPDGKQGRVHFSSWWSTTEWLVEIRASEGLKNVRWKEGRCGQVFNLPGNASLKLIRRYYRDTQLLHLWIAEVKTGRDMPAYLDEHGLPISYRTDEHYPLSYYQTLFSFHPGSAEMPSAARGFTPELVDRLLKKGVTITPILLHTGVSSLEENEAPYPEYMEIDPITVSLVNRAKVHGKRIIAVGTTVIRALESGADSDGRLKAFRGYTDLYINGSYESKVADGLITGFHEPRASHLHIIRSVAGNQRIEAAYKAAIAEKYYWHQFGDIHLIL